MGFSLSDTLLMASVPGLSQNASHLHTSEDSIIYLAPTADTNKCWPIRPTLRNELDTFSVHFYVFFGPNISIPPDRAAVFAINLMPVLDSGGVLNMELKLNLVSCRIRYFILFNFQIDMFLYYFLSVETNLRFWSAFHCRLFSNALTDKLIKHYNLLHFATDLLVPFIFVKYLQSSLP